ncbi:MAG: hypothetical protein JHC38_03705 [Thiotrichales bacterium]|nr:hypothetical protein [Thiotrichales bacterium]
MSDDKVVDVLSYLPILDADEFSSTEVKEILQLMLEKLDMLPVVFEASNDGGRYFKLLSRKAEGYR